MKGAVRGGAWGNWAWGAGAPNCVGSYLVRFISVAPAFRPRSQSRGRRRQSSNPWRKHAYVGSTTRVPDAFFCQPARGASADDGPDGNHGGRQGGKGEPGVDRGGLCG